MPKPSIRDLPAERMGRVAGHPAQLRMFRVITALIAALRECYEFGDYYEFQGELFQQVALLEAWPRNDARVHHVSGKTPSRSPIGPTDAENASSVERGILAALTTL